MKPSFVAPSQPLEKSLKEHIQKTAGLADWETGGAASKAKEDKSKKGHKRDKKSKSKESSPSDPRKSSKI